MLSEVNFEKTAMEALQDRQLYAPLEIASFQFQPQTAENLKGRPDALIQVRWQGKDVSFIAELKSRSSPQMAQQAIWQLKNFSNENNNLLLIVPYLSNAISEMITKEKISAIDLNGNYFIQTQGLLAIRLDKENRYKESKAIKKIFSGNSSLVGRLFLKGQNTFNSLNQICQAISKLDGDLTVSTISKVLKGLEEELIVQKESKQIKLIQPAKLLEKLKNEYSPPKIQETLKLNVPDPLKILRDYLPNRNWTLTGESSASRYSVTTPPKILSAYVTEFKDWDKYVDERFYNLVLKKTGNRFVYFDVQKDNYSSKLQCYLELSQLDKREREIAQSIQEDILGAFK